MTSVGNLSDLDSSPSRRRWIAAALFVGTFLLYCKSISYPFIIYDDPEYVFQNPHVRGGLTVENINWAFTTGHQSNWHPLTWLSLQFDAQLAGGEAASGYRITNLLLHAANATILFAVLTGLTGSAGRSAVVAALFAAHPLRVESVVWVTERKDVLSTFFWLLGLAAYLRYTRRPCLGTYVPIVVCLGLGLMAKPMLVTFPCVLLLLDYWPLRRLSGGMSVGRLVVEKLPLFVVVATSAFITMQIQSAGGAVQSFEQFPLSSRFANAIVAYAVYVRQSIWPAGLAPFYPFVQLKPWGVTVLVVGASLVAITAACIRWGRTFPFLPVGWFWYLGTLVPVIGLIQVGGQAHADRYTYVPQIGLLIVVVWGVSELMAWRKASAQWQLWLPIAAVGICSLVTWRQISFWRDNVSLWSHSLEVTSPENAIVQQNLGISLAEAGRFEEALPHLQAGARLDPGRFVPHWALAQCLISLGRLEEAIESLLTAERLSPDNSELRAAIGTLLAQVGRDEEAYPRLLAADPRDPAGVQLSLGKSLLGRQEIVRARARFEKAVALAPDRSETQSMLGIAFLLEGRPDAAEQPLREAVKFDPNNSRARSLYGLVQSHRGDTTGAIASCRAAVAADPQSALAHANLGLVLTDAGQTEAGNQSYVTATRLDPTWASESIQFAWVAAVGEPDRFGMFLPRCQARQACQASAHRNPRALLALAAVEAADQRFTDAIGWATRARTEAEKLGDVRLAQEADAELRLFEQRQRVPRRELP